MAMLVIFMAIGFICAKTGVTNAESNKYSSKLVMNVFLVCTILNSVINIEPSFSSKEIWIFFGLVCLGFFVMGLIAWFFPPLMGIKGNDIGISRAICIFMNSSFVGIPVVEILYGSEAVFYLSLTNIPFNLLLYSIGLSQINSSDSQKFSWKQMINGPIISTFVALLIFIFRFPVPTLISDTLSTMSGATIPMSMLVIGTSLGGIPIKKGLGDWRVYALSLVKLIVCPIAVWAVLSLLTTNALMIGIMVIIAACPTAMVLTVVCIDCGKDESLSSRCIFVSTVLSAITIPLIAWAFL